MITRKMLDEFIEHNVHKVVRGDERLWHREGANLLADELMGLVKVLERYRFVGDTPGVSQFSWAAEALAALAKRLEEK